MYGTATLNTSGRFDGAQSTTNIYVSVNTYEEIGMLLTALFLYFVATPAYSIPVYLIIGTILLDVVSLGLFREVAELYLGSDAPTADDEIFDE